MSYPGRVHRGRPAPHHPDHPRPAGESDPGPQASPTTPTALDHAPATTAATHDHLSAQRSRRGITRPRPVCPSDELVAPAAGRSTTGQVPARAEPLLYTPEQAADLLQIRPSWLRRKAAARAVPCRSVGKHLRFSRADIETIAENSTTPSRHFP
ncbi:helix-turn-helix domain-containing protein [Actinophytocola sediminis]